MSYKIIDDDVIEKTLAKLEVLRLYVKNDEYSHYPEYKSDHEKQIKYIEDNLSDLPSIEMAISSKKEEVKEDNVDNEINIYEDHAAEVLFLQKVRSKIKSDLLMEDEHCFDDLNRLIEIYVKINLEISLLFEKMNNINEQTYV